MIREGLAHYCYQEYAMVLHFSGESSAREDFESLEFNRVGLLRGKQVELKGLKKYSQENVEGKLKSFSGYFENNEEKVYTFTIV